MIEQRKDLNDLELVQDEVGGWYYVTDTGLPYTGVLYELYANGQLAYEGKYEDGYKMGLQNYWFENGQTEEKNFSCWDWPHGHCQSWNEDGRLVFEAEYKYGYCLWSNTYDEKGNILDSYDIGQKPQDQLLLTSRINTLRKNGTIEKWDLIIKPESDQ